MQASAESGSVGSGLVGRLHVDLQRVCTALCPR